MMVLRERTIQVIFGPRLLPWRSFQGRPLGTKRERERPPRGDMTETRRVAQAGSSHRLGVTFSKKQSWWTDSFFLFYLKKNLAGGLKLMHHNREPSGKGTWTLQLLSRRGEPEHSLTYGKMEAGAEASPQQHPRRKPVQHGLEDQKRVSEWVTLVTVPDLQARAAPWWRSGLRLFQRGSEALMLKGVSG